MSDEGSDALKASVEAILMVSERPIGSGEFAAVLDIDEDVIDATLRELAAEYRGEGEGRRHGFELRHNAGGWRIYSSPDHSAEVSQFVVGAAPSRLSQAALETLAVIAYRQPISRPAIAAIRGVNVDGVVRTLVTRGLVEEVGQGDTGAYLYGTTTAFLEHMGMDSLEELAPLAPFLPADDQLGDLETQLEDTQ